jgi:serine/threonine protein kinase
MSWPLASDFSAIVQQPRIAFRDPQLKECRIDRNALNQPRVWSGQFAVVYKGIDPQGKAWALRAFTTQAGQRREHYAHIADHLKARRVRCLVNFEYREAAIRSPRDGRWYPLVVMDWVEGMTLFEWVSAKCRQGKGVSLAKAVAHWMGLVEELNRAQVAHGDLQHANVLITAEGQLRLVDYDGMCVPAVAGQPNVEIGIRPYQHPQRNDRTRMSANLDRFSTWVIYVALRALAAEPSLWVKHVAQSGYDRLLFRSEDFLNRKQSTLYRDLLSSPDLGVRELATQLFAFACGPLDDVPALTRQRVPEMLPAEPQQPPVPIPAKLLPGKPAEKAPLPVVCQLVLEVIEGPNTGTRFTIDRHDTFVAGRAPDCHLRIHDDPEVSRHHFLLEALPPHARLRDLGSRNGTWVNEVRHAAQGDGEPAAAGILSAQVDLKHEDTIKVGHTVIRVLVKQSQASPPAAEFASPVNVDAGRLLPQSERIVDRLEIGPELEPTYLATVRRAIVPESGQVVALKILPRLAGATDAVQEHLAEELAPLQELRHPHIAALLESGIRKGALYCVSEFCDAGSLEQMLQQRGGKALLAHVRPLMLECLDALAWAHQRGIVHGHLTPHNILLQRRDNRVIGRISDFALAVMLDRAGCTGMSATTHFRAHFQFAPPERITRYRESLPASDLWSLAAIFYYALTGQYANDVANRDPLAAVLQPQIVPIRDRDRDISPPLAKVIDRALAAEVERRYHTAAEMKTHLKQAFDSLRGG